MTLCRYTSKVECRFARKEVFMTFNEALRKVSGILAVIQKTPQPPSSIIVRKKEIMLVEGKPFRPIDRTIAYLNRQRIQEGLSSLEWDIVEHKLRELIKRGLL